ncbi:MAG: hypothetical protein KJO31_18705 [Gammaproteobacteria bacterium]|nr:hypothetical protein [Gammaproteobacteria bacterium]
MRLIGQALAFAAFFAFVATFSAGPGFELLAEDEALLSLSFSHAAARVGECTRLSQQELQQLPPNMRTPDQCPRGRHPLDIELRIDGVTVYAAVIPPSGFHADGKATVYERVRLGAGPRHLQLRINDAGGAPQGGLIASRQLHVQPGQNIAVFLDADNRRIVFEQGEP